MLSEDEDMGEYYGKKILAGEMTIEDVPKLWRKKTQDWLDAHGE